MVIEHVNTGEVLSVSIYGTMQTNQKAGELMSRYEEKELQQEMQMVEKYLSDYLRDPGYGGAVGNILRDMENSKGKRRSEERRVGKECTSWCRSRWSPYH